MQVGKLKNRVIINRVIVFLLCGAVGWYLKGRLTPQGYNMAGMANMTPYVMVQEISAQSISPKKSFIGHVEPIKSVDLKPQVDGYLEKVLFEEGSKVNEGDILFVIEQKRYLANVQLAEADLDKAKANLVKMERDYKRQVSLSRQNIASKATFDNAESNYLQAKAAVKQAEANLELAKINLNYTEIKAPFTGYIGKALVTEGNYVNTSTESLARIVQTDPIRVAFSITDKDMIDAAQKIAVAGDDAIKTELVLPNGQILVNHLQSRFNDNEVNPDTATIAVYAEYENNSNLLIPGSYVDILLGDKEDIMAVLVPQAAVAQDEHGNYVYVVNEENIAEQRRVSLGEVFEDKQVVLDGLATGEKVIIQGLQKVKNGQKVKASLVKDQVEVK